MPQLTHTVEGESKIIITESVANAKLLLEAHSYFEFVFSAGVGHNLPVMTAIHKGSISNHRAEQVIWLKKKGVTTVLAKVNLFWAIKFVPAKLIVVIVKKHHLIKHAVDYGLLIPQKVICVFEFLDKSSRPRVVSWLADERWIEAGGLLDWFISMSCIRRFYLLIQN